MTEDNSTHPLSELNIPKILLGPAGDAISRLIGAGVDIPVAFLEQHSQKIKDRTNANSIVSDVLARAVSDELVKDKGILERAKLTFADDLMRKQKNRENVAKQTLEILNQEELEKESGPIDQDWMNEFVDLSEKASSDRMQERWAKILANEIKGPGYFDKKTLQIVDTLPHGVANRFEEYANYLFDEEMIYKNNSALQGKEFTDLVDFDNYGLVKYSHAYRIYPFNDVGNNQFFGFMKFSGYNIGLFKNNNSEIKLNGHFLTPAGKQIAKIRNKADEIDAILLKEVLDRTDIKYAVRLDVDASISLSAAELASNKNLIYEK